MNDQQKAAATFISGYLRGLWERTETPPDHYVLGALKTLKVPQALIPYPPIKIEFANPNEEVAAEQ
jgi:hypothetical protein